VAARGERGYAVVTANGYKSPPTATVSVNGYIVL
jgi:hypothetical protein